MGPWGFFYNPQFVFSFRWGQSSLLGVKPPNPPDKSSTACHGRDYVGYMSSCTADDILNSAVAEKPRDVH